MEQNGPQLNIRKASRKKEFYAGDVKIDQLPPVVEQGLEETGSLLPRIHVVDKAKHGALTKDYLDELSFMEEPVTVRFSSGMDRFAPKFVDCAVNGKGIEVLINGHWLEMFQVPVNQNVTMKRKYLEVFAHCKHTDVVARHRGVPYDGSQPINDTIPNTNLKYPFSVLEDRNPRGAEWLTRILVGQV
jgi:hypothetical protein